MNLTPQLVFLLVWCFPLFAAQLIESNMLEPLSQATVLLIVGNVGFFFLGGFVLRLALGMTRVQLAPSDLEVISLVKFERSLNAFLYAWLVVYIANIVGSGGLPFLWLVAGDGRTYVDFGLPTLGGLANMLRAFVLSGCYIAYIHPNQVSRRRWLVVGAMLLGTAFVLETGRGNGIVLLLHPVAIHFLFHRISIGQILKMLGLLAAVLILGGFIQSLRHGSQDVTIESYAENVGIRSDNTLELLLVPAAMYIALPVVNTNLNIALADDLKFEPYYSLQSIVPTLLRDRLFEQGDYGELIADAHNTTSMYTPLVRDYGSGGAFILVCVLLSIVCFCYVKAAQGYLTYILLWPSLFMSVVLSFFSLYFFTLVVLLYPLCAIVFMYASGTVRQISGRRGTVER